DARRRCAADACTLGFDLLVPGIGRPTLLLAGSVCMAGGVTRIGLVSSQFPADSGRLAAGTGSAAGARALAMGTRQSLDASYGAHVGRSAQRTRARKRVSLLPILMKVDLHRKYVRRCLLAIAAFSAGVFSIGWYVEPFSGDLARMGGYAERDFGWNGTQQGYPRPRFSLGAYEGYWDVVVLGDSFSFNESPFQWQNFFVATTGLSVITLDLRGGSPDAVLGSKAFRQHPPKLFIFESIERNLRQHLSHASSACPDLPRQTVRELQFARRPDESVAIKREHPLRSYLSHGYPLALLYRAVHRSVADEQKQAVRRFSLTRSDLFSSRSSDQLLVYEEVHGKPWSDAQVTEIRCGLRELRRRVEQNG